MVRACIALVCLYLVRLHVCVSMFVSSVKRLLFVRPSVSKKRRRRQIMMHAGIFVEGQLMMDVTDVVNSALERSATLTAGEFMRRFSEVSEPPSRLTLRVTTMDLEEVDLRPDDLVGGLSYIM